MGADPGRSAPPEHKPSCLRQSAVPAANDGCGMPLTPGVFCTPWKQGCVPASVYHNMGRLSRAAQTSFLSLLLASWQPGLWCDTRPQGAGIRADGWKGGMPISVTIGFDL
jgi:hypothetical protein